MNVAVALCLNNGPMSISFIAPNNAPTIEDIFNGKGQFAEVGSTDVGFNYLTPTNNFLTMMDLYGNHRGTKLTEQEIDQHFVATVTKKLTSAGYILDTETPDTLAAPSTDPRILRGVFNDFIIESSKLEDDKIEYRVSAGETTFFIVGINSQEGARGVSAMIDDYVESLRFLQTNLDETADMFPSETAIAEVAAPKVEEQALVQQEESYLTKLVGELGASEPKGNTKSFVDSLVEKVAEPAKPVKQESPAEVNENVVNRAVLLVARRGEPCSLEVIFTGNDAAAMKDMNFLGYVTDAIKGHGQAVYVASDDRHILILDDKLAKNYLLLLTNAVKDMKLNVQIDRRSPEQEPLRTDTVYL